jgi:SAM-dependent methyltransferase
VEPETRYYDLACERPGGLAITGRAVAYCGFPVGSRIIDVGCGSGLTVEFLRGEYELDATGVDVNTAGINRYLSKAPAEQLPFESASAEGIIMECSLSLFIDQITALKESHRVLKNGGRLIISDMYARGNAARLTGRLGRIDRRETIETLVTRNGFYIELWEDYTHLLQTWWGQMIIDPGMESFCKSTGCSPELLKRIKPGYFLMVVSRSVQQIRSAPASESPR